MNYDFWLKETILNTTISSHDTPVGLNFFRIRFQMNFNNIEQFKQYKSTVLTSITLYNIESESNTIFNVSLFFLFQVCSLSQELYPHERDLLRHQILWTNCNMWRQSLPLPSGVDFCWINSFTNIITEWTSLSVNNSNNNNSMQLPL